MAPTLELRQGAAATTADRDRGHRIRRHGCRYWGDAPPLIALLLVALAACGGGGHGPTDPNGNNPYGLTTTGPGSLSVSPLDTATVFAASPHKYFTAPLRDFYYSRSRVFEGVPADKDGRIDWSVSGRLVGDWFYSSLAGASYAASTGSMGGWVKTLGFVFDWYDNSPRISIGGTITSAGVLKPAATDPDPATVSTTSGLVAYQGTPKVGAIAAGWMLVQMIAADRIRVEYFAGATSRPAAFTGAAQEYIR